MPILDSEACNLRYEVWGEGSAVTLLHGFTSCIEQNWVDRGWVELLTSAGHRVIGLDLRGHGRSSKFYAPEQYETSLLALDVVRLLDALGLTRSDLVGFSLGAGTPAGDRLAGESAPPRRLRNRRSGHPRASRSRAHRADRDALAADDPDLVTSPLGRRIRAAAERGGNDVKALAAMVSRGGCPGDLIDPRVLNVPTLLGVSGRDEYMAGTAHLLELLPNAEVVTLEDASHTAILSDARFKHEVLRFLATAPATRLQ